jgi:hypothetical protein
LGNDGEEGGGETEGVTEEIAVEQRHDETSGVRIAGPPRGFKPEYGSGRVSAEDRRWAPSG